MKLWNIAGAMCLVFLLTIPASAQEEIKRDPVGNNSVLIQAIEAELAQQKQVRDNFAKTIANLESELKELEEALTKSLEEQDSIGVSSESFPAIMKSLQSQRIELTIDLAGLKAKREMLVQVQEELSSKENIAALAPLRQILALEEQSLELVKARVSQASAPKSELIAAKRRVLAAEVQIAEAKSSTGDSNYAAQINSSLLDTALEHAEKVARLQTTDSLLASLTDSRELVTRAAVNKDRIALTRRTLKIQESNLRDAETRVLNLQSQIKKLK